jgi:hypothetical protein
MERLSQLTSATRPVDALRMRTLLVSLTNALTALTVPPRSS